MHYILIMEFNHLIESDVKETGTSGNTYHLYDDKETFEVEFVRSTNPAERPSAINLPRNY